MFSSYSDLSRATDSFQRDYHWSPNLVLVHWDDIPALINCYKTYQNEHYEVQDLQNNHICGLQICLGNHLTQLLRVRNAPTVLPIGAFDLPDHIRTFSLYPNPVMNYVPLEPTLPEPAF
jgi:hypothetical protein